MQVLPDGVVARQDRDFSYSSPSMQRHTTHFKTSGARVPALGIRHATESKDYLARSVNFSRQIGTNPSAESRLFPDTLQERSESAFKSLA